MELKIPKADGWLQPKTWTYLAMISNEAKPNSSLAFFNLPLFSHLLTRKTMRTFSKLFIISCGDLYWISNNHVIKCHWKTKQHKKLGKVKETKKEEKWAENVANSQTMVEHVA